MAYLRQQSMMETTQTHSYVRQSWEDPYINKTLRLIKKDAYKIKSGRKKNKYVNIPMSFDIETTTMYQSEHAYMYIWQIGYICKGVQYVVKGRTWAEFDKFIRQLSKALSKYRILIWVHNLPFEFMFLIGRYYHEMSDMFCKEEWKPLKFVLFGNIEFRDSYVLTNKSLAKLAEDYTTTQKLKCDLDYSIERNHMTPLTEEEECYCDNDVIILCEFHQVVMRLWYANETIPLTQTAILRGMVKEGAIEEFGERVYQNRQAAKLLIQSTMLSKFPSEKLYKLMMNYCFKGGLTHALYEIAGDTLYDVEGYDYTSDYPAIMLQDGYYFPDAFTTAECHSWEELHNLMDEYCVMAIITFNNIRTTTGHTLISHHKAMACEGAILDNGKIRYAKSLKVMETELDIKTYEKFYKWEEDPIIHHVWVAKRIQLPEYLKKPIRDNYVAKAALKKQELPYANEKAIVNAGYGLTVQRMIEQEVKFEGHFYLEPAEDYETQVAKSVLLPQWGCWITAWARYNLAMTIWQSPDTIYYYDTDSIKCHMTDKLSDYIKRWNESRARINQRMCERYGIDFELFGDLGMWDCETKKFKMARFKTLGAKRYIYEQGGEFKQTIAGLGKTALMDETNGHIDECFRRFKHGMRVYETGKLRSKRNIKEHEEMVNGCKMHEYSSIALIPVEFTLHLTQAYMMLIDGYKKRIKNLEKRRD